MKRLLLLSIVLLFASLSFSQDTDLTDRVNIEQNNQKFMGVFSYAYQDLQPNGFSLFQLHNYGGTPAAPLATPGSKILGAFMFSGYDGSAKKQLAELRVSTLAGFTPTNTPVRMDFIVGPDRLKRLSILGDSGFVGVGTSVPTTEFDVNGNIRMRTGATAGYIPVSDADGVMTWTDPSTIATASLWEESGDHVYRSAGRVGIGGVPSAKLHIRQDTSTLQSGIRLESHTGNEQDWYMYMDSLDNFTFRDDATVAMLIENSSRNLGLSTIEPTERLDVNGNIRMRFGATDGYIPVSDADGKMTWTDPSSIFTASPWTLNGSNNAYFDTGRVGIGTDSPIAQLHVSTNSVEMARFESTATSKWISIYTGSTRKGILWNSADDIILRSDETGSNLRFQTDGNNDRMTINATGVGIGTSNPGNTLDVVGDGSGDVATFSSGGSPTNIVSFNTSAGNAGYVGSRTVAGDMEIGTGPTSTNSVNLTTQNEARLSVKADGNVGINTLAPTAKLEVVDTVGATQNYTIKAESNRNDASTNVIRADYTYDGFSDGRAILGSAFPATGYGYGGQFDGGYIGSYDRGLGTTYTSTAYGTYSQATGSAGTRKAVYGTATNTGGNAYGGDFTSTANGAGKIAYGVRGYANHISDELSYGVYADHHSDDTGYSLYINGQGFATSGGVLASDERFKKDIKEVEGALDIINELQPKTYNFRQDGEFSKLNFDDKLQYGFIAQELEEVLPDAVHDVDVVFSDAERQAALNDIDRKEEGLEDNTYTQEYKGVNYTALIPVLTQGIKELSATVEEKEEVIESLVSDNEELKTEVSELTKQMEQMAVMMDNMNDKFNQMEEDMSSCCFGENKSKEDAGNTFVELNGSDVPALEQNSPNPFHEQTVIRYYIPSSARSANMTITDIKGSPLKSVNLEETGLGTVTINANELPVGTYIYTLFVDGRQVESKQMILVR